MKKDEQKELYVMLVLAGLCARGFPVNVAQIPAVAGTAVSLVNSALAILEEDKNAG